MAKNPEGITIHRVHPGNYGLFDNILPEVFDHQIDRERLAAHLASPSHFLAVAMDGDAMVAMVMANIHLHPDKPNELFIDELGTSPGYRNRGIGTRLMEEAIAWGRENNCEECWLGTELDNDAANAIYRKWEDEPETFLLYEFDI